MITAKESLKHYRQVLTSGGPVYLEGPVTAGELERLSINDELKNFRSPGRQKEALIITARSPEGLVYIARHQQEIVGYVMFHPPSSYTRWSKHPRLLELGAIEVSRRWQRQGIARALLQAAFSNRTLEEYVIITTEFYWHWDLKGSGLDVWSYQRMLNRLFGSAGFKKRRTDDPEILEHPANMLMVRFGKNLSSTYIKAFEELTYQNTLTE